MAAFFLVLLLTLLAAGAAFQNSLLHHGLQRSFTKADLSRPTVGGRSTALSRPTTRRMKTDTEPAGPERKYLIAGGLAFLTFSPFLLFIFLFSSLTSSALGR